MRYSPTDKKGRIHTSLITVAVLKAPDTTQLTIKESDIEFRTLRAFGKGGQHSSKTESGVVLKHTPTGIEAKSTSDRSQHANKELALEVLKSRIFEHFHSKEEEDTSSSRSKQVGTGHRSDKIRTIRVCDNTVKCERTGKIKSFKEYAKGNLEF